MLLSNVYIRPANLITFCFPPDNAFRRHQQQTRGRRAFRFGALWSTPGLRSRHLRRLRNYFANIWTPEWDSKIAKILRKYRLLLIFTPRIFLQPSDTGLRRCRDEDSGVAVFYRSSEHQTGQIGDGRLSPHLLRDQNSTCRLGLQRARRASSWPLRNRAEHREQRRMLRKLGRWYNEQVTPGHFHINSNFDLFMKILIFLSPLDSLSLPLSSLLVLALKRMLCATVENGVDSCNGKKGVEFTAFRSTHSLWTSNLAIHSFALCLQVIQVAKRLLLCMLWTFSFYAKRSAAGTRKKLRTCLQRSRKFSQLLNKNLFS